MRCRSWFFLLVVASFTLGSAAALNNLNEINVVVFPDVASSTFAYNFVFSSSPTCNPVLLNASHSITTNTAGRGNATIDLTSLTQVPAYLCTYRSGILVDTQSMNPNAFEQGNVTQTNATAGWPAVWSTSSNLVASAIDFSFIMNVPSFALQSYLTSLTANFTGNQSVFNTSITNLQVAVNTINNSYAQQTNLASLTNNYTGNQSTFNTSITDLQVGVRTINATVIFNTDDVVNASNLNVSATGTTGQVLTLNSTGGMNWTTPLLGFNEINFTEIQQTDSSGAGTYNSGKLQNLTLYLDPDSYYILDCLFFQSAAATTTGVQMRFNTTGTPDALRYVMTYYTSAVAEAICQGTNTASNSCAATASSGATVAPARYFAYVNTGASQSVFTVELATEVDTSAARIELGSFCRATRTT